MKEVILITGAGSGLANSGEGSRQSRTYGVRQHVGTTNKNADKVRHFAQHAKENDVELHTIELDVASDRSAKAALRRLSATRESLMY